MEFAENGRISHRQLYRQMILTLLAPFLLGLFGQGKIWGIEGVFGTVTAIVLLIFYTIFLIRLAPYYGDAVKITGGFSGRIIGIFFLTFVILSGAFLLSILEEIVPKALVTGISGKWISFTALLVSSIGAHRGMQRRGRMAEVSGGFLLGGIFLMMLVCLGQGKMEYFREILTESTVNTGDIFSSGYVIMCGFSSLGVMPFLLEDVEKQGSAGKTVILGILTLGGILIGFELLLPAVFGMGRLAIEKYPVLPLLAGANLPGNILARFDVLWMGFLLYSMLFAVGSVLHYGHLIIRKTHLGTGRIWIAVLIYIASILELNGVGVKGYFMDYLAYIFLPGLLLIQIFMFWKGRGRWKKHGAVMASALTLSLVFGGCSGAVEPEKRMYPLALGVDADGDEYAFLYGMPNLAEATGQEKGGSGGSQRTLELRGKDFQEIETLYNRSQSKFLDLGHLEVLILGKNMLQEDRWMVFLDYLKKKPLVGEDVYVFLTDNPAEVLNWKGDASSSVGEYLAGMMENRMTGQKIKSVTLREVFHERYKNHGLAALPQIRVTEKKLEAVWE